MNTITHPTTAETESSPRLNSSESVRTPVLPKTTPVSEAPAKAPYPYPIWAWAATVVAIAATLYLTLAFLLTGKAGFYMMSHRGTFVLGSLLIGLFIATAIYDAWERRVTGR